MTRCSRPENATTEIRREGDLLIVHDPPIKMTPRLHGAMLRPSLIPAMLFFLFCGIVYFLFRFPLGVVFAFVAFGAVFFVIQYFRAVRLLTSMQMTLLFSPEELRVETNDSEKTIPWNRVKAIFHCRESDEDGELIHSIRIDDEEDDPVELFCDDADECDWIDGEIKAYLHEWRLFDMISETTVDD